MVLWSYLLLGLPASASLDRVLAPIDTNSFESRESAIDETDEENTSGSFGALDDSVDDLDLLSEIERQLTNRLQPGGVLRLIPVSQMPSLANRKEMPEVLLIDHPSRLRSSTILVRLRLMDGDQILGNYALQFRVQVMAEVWAPVRRLAIGDELFSEDVEVREVDLIRESKAVPADSTIFGRYEVARAVQPDRVLTWTDLAPRELVKKGGLVSVVASEGMLSITMKGQATRSGALGEVVTIRNLESLREFAAEVVDENTVRVQF
jgi:flagella basal body P-ring formation protein FlgA